MASSSGGGDGDGDGEGDGEGDEDGLTPLPRLRRTAFGLCSTLDGRPSDGRLGVPSEGRLGVVCFIPYFVFILAASSAIDF